MSVAATVAPLLFLAKIAATRYRYFKLLPRLNDGYNLIKSVHVMSLIFPEFP
jgi:hypothetical protein